MPEGDVVHRAATRLHAALAGRELTHADLRWPSLATADLTGREVVEVVSHGKHLLMRLRGGLTLHSHLRMDGSWHLHRTGERWATRRPEPGVRARLVNTDWTAVGHRLGMLDLVATSSERDLVGHLGPDLLNVGWDGAGWDSALALANLGAEPHRSIGEALLDQRLLAGIGTFYLAEACFLRGVTPWTPVGEVPDLGGLIERARTLMSANAGRGVQVTTGDARPGREQWVHGRSGRPCRRCGTTVRVAPVGAPPRERTAFYCPSCQRGPAPTDPAPTDPAPRTKGTPKRR